MTPDTIKAIQQALEPLANKLGQSAAGVYQIYVKQAALSGMVWTGVDVGLILLIVIYWSLILKYYKRLLEDYLDGGMALLLGGGMATIFIVVLVIVSLPDNVMSILNPQYYALQNLLSTLKGGQ